MPIFLKLFQKFAEEGTFPNSLYKATITLTWKSGKDNTKKKIWVNITDEHRFKNPQENSSKQNSVSVQSLSRVRLFAAAAAAKSDTLQPHELQHARPPCPSPTLRVYPNSCPSSWWCHPTISSSVVSFSSCLQSSQHQGLFKWASSSHQVAKILEFQFQHQSFQWTAGTDFL